MWLLTAEAMRRLDRATIEAGHASGETLMERAGSAVVQAMERRYGPLLGLRVLVLCGTGRNGGDGFVAARHLRARGAVPRVGLLGARGRVKDEARVHLERMEADGVRATPVESDEALAKLLAPADEWDFALDALLGTGARGAPEGLVASGVQALRDLDDQGTRVVAVDLPTGVDGDRGTVARRAVRADLTVTFGAAKRAHFLYPARAFAGALEVADIGLLPPPGGDPDYTIEVATAAAMAARVPVRDPRAHKRSVGQVLVVGGSVSLTGAVVLAARGATRAGAGYVQAMVPAGLLPLLAARLTSEMVIPAAESAGLALAPDSRSAVLEQAGRCDALVLGPGISREPGALELARAVALGASIPAVVDADALNAFEGCAERLREAHGPRVLTPHLGEMARLTGLASEALEAGRIDEPRAWAKRWNVVVVLKGAPTVIAAPDERVTVNPTGNPGMATAGAGDVLGGAIAALIAQGLEPYEAAGLACYVHGRAGDLVAARRGQQGMCAGDLAEALPEAIFELARLRDRAPLRSDTSRRRRPAP